MKDEHRLYVIIILVVVIFSEFLGVFDDLFTPNITSNNVRDITNDPLNRFASDEGIGSNEQYSNPMNVGVNGNLYAKGRRRHYLNPKNL